MMKKTLAAVLVAAALVSGACSDDKPDNASSENGGESTETTSANGTTQISASNVGPGAQTTATMSAPSSTTTAPGAAGGSATTSPQSTTSTTGLLATRAALSKACVKVGEIQSIVIETEPGSVAGYNSTYSDGNTGTMSGFYGGNNGGKVDGDGRYKDSWAIGAGAPPGRVRVDVKSAKHPSRFGDVTLYFEVADATGRCPGA